MQSDNDFFKYLDQLIEYTGISRAEIFNGCYDIYSSIHLSANDLLQMAKNLQVDPVKLWCRNLDLEVLKNKHNGITLLPELYSDVCASSIVSIKHALLQFKKFGLYDYALKRIQIDEKMIETRKSISVLAGNDLLILGNGFFSERNYADIAKRNAAFAYDNILKNEIKANMPPCKIAKEIVELVGHFEQNWSYKITKSDLNSITIETQESELMRSAKGYRSFTNNMTSFIRFHFLKEALGMYHIQAQHVGPLSDWNNQNKKFQFSINL